MLKPNGVKRGDDGMRLMGFSLRPVCLALAGAILGFGGQAFAEDGATTCQLGRDGNNIQHVIYIQFDNTHFRRDIPNVPSDLEQMPHLLNFIKGNGALLTNHHTGLISHTATGILTSLTGVYGDRMGQPISNSFRYFNPNGSSNLGVSFAYWTDPLYDPTTSTPTDTTPQMIDERGKIAPAPWVPYTRAGCNVGVVAAANTVLENIKTDIPTVFGNASPEAQEVATNPAQAFADFVGIAIHCAKDNMLCSGAQSAQPDRLPDEPGGYLGYQALFGHKYVAPVISPKGPLLDLNGQLIEDASSPSHVGFPGFDGMLAAVSLSYVAAMQEHGVPVTYAYISDAHDNHLASGNKAFGPGEAGYVRQLKAYDDAFAKFFERLAADGINRSNTLFVFTADEGDHFVGGAPTPADCDGVSTPCAYTRIGEINANIAGLLATQQGNTTPFMVHADSAPVFYVTGNPERTAPNVRKLEQDVSQLSAVNPITGNLDSLTLALADPVEMKLLHMISADPMRTPTFVMFADPNYYLYAGKPDCSAPCVSENPAYAWNHGDITNDIAQTWLGLVGPGVKRESVADDDEDEDRNVSKVWSDHADIRPTMLALLGLHDTYVHDGRVLIEPLHAWAVPKSLRAHRRTLIRLGQVYKAIYAPFGQLGMDSLMVSTKALKSNDHGDATYTALEHRLAIWTDERNALATRMKALLDGAAFKGQAINEREASALIDEAEHLLARVRRLAIKS